MATLKYFTIVLVTLLIIPSFSDGIAGKNPKVIEVHPGESIQKALDRATSGDTVFVHRGTYKPEKAGEAFIIFRKRHNGIMLKGESSKFGSAVIDGDKKVLHVVYFDQGIDRSTVMSGFTIRGGNAYPSKILPDRYDAQLRPEIGFNHDFYHDGSGVMVYNSSPVIMGNTITNNNAERCGGGISIFVARPSVFSINRWFNFFKNVQSPLIYNNTISHNSAGITGAGIDVYHGTKAIIVNNMIVSNRSNSTGGAIAVLLKASAEIHGNSIIGNKAKKDGSGLKVIKGAMRVNITNTIFVKNQYSDVISAKGDNIDVLNSCFYQNDGDYLPPSNNGNIYEKSLYSSVPKDLYGLNKQLSKRDALGPCSDNGFKSVSHRIKNVEPT